MEGHPMHRRILYLALWERADLLGFSKVQMVILSEMCGQYTFMHEDIDALDPLVKRKGRDEVFLPHFLITQRSSISLKSPGAEKIWKALGERFPGTTKGNIGPYADYMRSIGAFSLIPDMPEHVVADRPPPEWMVKHLELIQQAKAYPTPSYWPTRLLLAYTALLDNYFKISESVTNKMDANRFRIGSSQVDNLQKQIQNILNEGYSPEVAEEQIRASLSNNRLAVYLPSKRP